MATMTGTDSGDNILGTADADTITGGLGWDTIQGGAGNDWIQGGADNDTLYGGAGSDSVEGGDGDDTLSMGPGEGNDTLVGGLGNDSITVWPLGPHGTQYAQVDGGEGNDQITVAVMMGSVAADAVTATGGAGQDTYRFYSGDGAWGLTVTDFEAGAGGDCVELWKLLEYSGSRGYQGGNPFAEGNGFLRLVQSGADTLLQYDQDGAAGFLYGWHTAATLRDVDANTLTADNFLGVAPDGSSVPGRLFEGTGSSDSLQGSFFDDTISGGAGGDSLWGNGGNDWIDGGDEEGVGDYIEGGAGHDTLHGGAGNDTLRGGGGNDSVNGGAGNDYLIVLPGDGNDTLFGGDGNDFLQVTPLGFNGPQAIEVHGGDGDDSISMGALVDGTETVLVSGGAGQDTYRFSSGDRARGLTITDFQAGAGGDRFELESLVDYSSMQGRGYEGGNPFAAEQGYVRLVQDGADTLLQYDEDGAAGTAHGWHTAAVLRDVDANALTVDNFAYFSPDGAAIEGRLLAGTDFADQLLGWWGNDTLRGGLGNDMLDGQTGADLLDGGEGADYLLGYIGNDTLRGGAGNDMLEGEVGDDSLDGGDGDDILVSAYGGNDTLVGGTGADRFQLSLDSSERQAVRVIGGEGNDHFQVGSTRDGTVLATGGTGRDTYFFVYGALSKGLTVSDFETGAGGDLVDLSRLMEHSVTFGGFTGGNPMAASQGYLRLVKSGTDTLLQQDEDGAAGKTSGWHTVVRIKDVAPSEITADNFVAVKREGAAWSEQLLGGLGRDTLSGLGGDDTLDGGWGGDSMLGGLGNDSYGVHDLDDIVRELVDEGVDTVRASIDWKLGANLENLVLEAGAVRATGNAMANLLTGNDTANVLAGGTGRDTLAGGGGADVLVGGDGRDVLKGGAGRDVFDLDAAGDSTVAASGRDRITDFIAGNGGDRIDLSGIDAKARTAANDAFTFIGSKGFNGTNATGQLRYEYDAGTGVGVLYGSTDADAAAEFAVELTGVSALAAVNLIL